MHNTPRPKNINKHITKSKLGVYMVVTFPIYLTVPEEENVII